MNRVLLIQEKLKPPFCCTANWKLFWIFKKMILFDTFESIAGGGGNIMCVCLYQKSVCKEYRTHLQSSASGFFMPDQRHFLSRYSYSLKHRHTLLLWCTAYNMWTFTSYLLNSFPGREKIKMYIPRKLLFMIYPLRIFFSVHDIIYCTVDTWYYILYSVHSKYLIRFVKVNIK